VLRRATALAIVGTSEDFSARKYNTAIAKMMSLTNAILDATRAGAGGPVVREALETLLTVLAPVCPFITEELWQRFGHEGSVHDQPWPRAEVSLLVDEQVQVVVQVNGKVRGRVTVPAGAPADEVEAAARADEVVAPHLDGEVSKVIVIPDKLINFVVAG
jgi:leucyl-tRNA synthetase